MMLEGTARTWLKSLPANSINSWDELKPKDFKGPRKVPNYTADQPPEAWVESYEMAMEMLDVDEAACAKYSP